jgi:hypothetical protein
LPVSLFFFIYLLSFFFQSATTLPRLQFSWNQLPSKNGYHLRFSRLLVSFSCTLFHFVFFVLDTTHSWAK